jgi:D-lactate dehydrogenase
MQVTVFSCRAYDELPEFKERAEELGLTLVTTSERPSLENLHLVEGSQCIDVVTTPVDRELLQALYDKGVRYVVTRCIGYDHIDVEAAKEIGITVANTPYGPNGVADYAVMLILMCIRKMGQIMARNAVQDYTLRSLIGRELNTLTVGVIGTGRIGMKVIKNLSGFGCKIICCDLYKNKAAEEYASYVSFEELIEQSDVITLHTPLTEDNFHMINAEAMSKMKDGVIIINTARGSLIDTAALCDYIENGKVGAAGLDVVENEFDMYYYDRKSDVLTNRELNLFRSYPNVIVSHHMAFFTNDYLRTIVGDSLKGCKAFMTGTENPWVVSK